MPLHDLSTELPHTGTCWFKAWYYKGRFIKFNVARAKFVPKGVEGSKPMSYFLSPLENIDLSNVWFVIRDPIHGQFFSDHGLSIHKGSSALWHWVLHTWDECIYLISSHIFLVRNLLKSKRLWSQPKEVGFCVYILHFGPMKLWYGSPEIWIFGIPGSPRHYITLFPFVEMMNIFPQNLFLHLRGFFLWIFFFSFIKYIQNECMMWTVWKPEK